jgi:hypothetical protein
MAKTRRKIDAALKAKIALEALREHIRPDLPHIPRLCLGILPIGQ